MTVYSNSEKAEKKGGNMCIKEWWFSRADCPVCDGTGEEAGGVDFCGETILSPCVYCDGTGKTTWLIARKLRSVYVETVC